MDVFSKLWRLALFLILYTTFLIIIFKSITKSNSQASFSAIVVIFASLYFGQDSKIPDRWNVYQQDLPVMIIAFVLFLAVLFWTLTPRFAKIFRPERFTRFLNLCGIVWLIIPIFHISSFLINFYRDPIIRQGLPYKPYTGTRSDQKPDIYYIILDGYGSNDILQDYYHYDNSSFTSKLEKQGFFIASQSDSNYQRTQFSIASSLNSEYLTSLQDAPISAKGVYEYNLIRDNRLSLFLKTEGYKLVGFNSGFMYSNAVPLDIRYSASKTSFSTFETTYLNNTAFGFFRDLRRKQLQSGRTRDIPYDELRKRILFELNSLPEIASDPDPTFTFVHVVAPHPPFIFAADGQAIYPDYRFYIGDGDDYPSTRKDYLEKYPAQLEYINTLVINSVRGILKQSTQPPIIIIQGDHGPGAYLAFDDIEKTCLRERTSILNAYYLPSEMQKSLYASMTPVNTFRVVLDGLFGTKLGLLNDSVFFSEWSNEHHFEEVTTRVNDKCNIAGE